MTATRAWILLLALSAASTGIAASGAAGLCLSLAILVLAWGKAILILRAYLGLAAAPTLDRGFALVLGLYMLGLLVLVAAAG